MIKQTIKKAISIILVFLVLLVIINYLFQSLLQNIPTFVLGFILVWTILLPLISSIPHRLVYFLSLPAPVFGAWFLLFYLFINRNIYSVYVGWLSILLVLPFILGLHFITRKRSFIKNISMRSISRVMIATTSIIFFLYGIISINPTAFSLGYSQFFYFFVALFAYVATSLLYVNSCYRYYRISERLKINNIKKYLSTSWFEISKKYPLQERDLDSLRYYISESIEDFIEGNFDRSFIWGYKAIHEPTIVNPMLFVNDKREAKCSFAEIRTTIGHSRRGGEHIEVGKIKQTLRNLFDDNLDLIVREFDLIESLMTQ
jgi:hypothetical protein